MCCRRVGKPAETDDDGQPSAAAAAAHVQNSGRHVYYTIIIFCVQVVNNTKKFANVIIAFLLLKYIYIKITWRE